MVLVDEPKEWVAFFCSYPAAGVADILGYVAARFTPEITFRDVKEVVGAGQQQVLGSGQRRGVPPVRVGIHDDRGVGLGAGFGGIGRPPRRVPLGRCRASAESRRQAAGVAARTAGE